MPNVAFVLPFAFETSRRFLRGALGLPGVRVGVISAESVDRLGPDIKRRLAGHWRVKDPLDPRQLVLGVRGLAKQLGSVDRLVGVLEQLQVPLAEAREELGLAGMNVRAATNFRDKSQMKDVLRAAGVPCARHKLARSADDVRQFVSEVGLPVVVKPPAGAGAKNTFRLDSPEQVSGALAAFPPSPGAPYLLEEMIQGQEHSFDSVCLGGRLVWWSVSRYDPAPLTVLENDWIQWCVVLPRDLHTPAWAPIRQVGEQAVLALGLEDGLSHMEWFFRPTGEVAVSEVGCRPPGAQITSLMSYAHDVDMYKAWSRLVCTDQFDPPERPYAAGAAYLRGQGQGERIKAVRGLEQAQREVGELVVEAQLPRAGQPRASGYEGDGFVIVRHPETAVVEEALRRIVSRVRVEIGA